MSRETLRDWVERPSWFGLPPAILVLVGVALVVRLVWVLAHPIAPVDDFLEYRTLAHNTAFNDYYGLAGEPAALRPPAFPFLLAGVYKVFGDTVKAGGVTVALLSWGCVVFGALIANRLLRPAYALLAVALLALTPSVVVYSGVLGTELPSAFVILAMIYVMARPSPGRWSGLLLGALEAVLLLTRSDLGLAMGLVLIVFAVLRWSEIRHPITAAALAALATVVLLTPWIIRNESAFGEFIPFSANGGLTFYAGTLDAGYTSAGPQFEDLPPFDKPGAQDSFYMDRGIENVRDDPVRWLKFDLERLGQGYGSDLRILAWGDAAPYGSAAFWAADAIWHLTALLALIGLVFIVVYRRVVDPTWVLIGLAVVAVTVIKASFLFDGRHRVPLMPLLALLAAFGAQGLANEIAKRRRA